MSETEAPQFPPDLTEFQKEFLAQSANPDPLLPELQPYLTRAHPDSKLQWDLLKHPLVFGVPYMPEMNYQYNRQFEAKKKAIDEYAAKGNWGGFVFMHERPYRFDVLHKIRRKLTGQAYWELMSAVWTDSENLWQVGTRKLQSMLHYQKEFRCFFMDGSEQHLFNQLPNKLRVFRGHREHNKSGFSWTLSYSKAQWFARRFQTASSGRPRVSQGFVAKDDVKGLMMGRGEMEIVVHPLAVKEAQPVERVTRPGYLESLRRMLIGQFKLGEQTDHGADHWEKVERNGIELCAMTPGADITVVRLFAVIHDSCRQDEYQDPGHGPRAAKLLTKIYQDGKLPEINDEQFKKLEFAVRKHNGHGPVDDLTIGTCFDSDRLDLLRVGMVPNPNLLSTDAGRRSIGVI